MIKGKKTLFVLGTLGAGGSSTSMINLLKLMNEQHAMKADVLLFHKEGLFSRQTYEEFCVLPIDPVLWVLAINKATALRKKPFLAMAVLVVYQFLSLIKGGRYNAKLALYKWRAKKYSNKYDNIVAFQEEDITAFVSFVKADNKIAWVHNDVARFPTVQREGKETVAERYGDYNKIVCVSEATRKHFCKEIPDCAKKTVTIYNPFIAEDIIKKSLKTGLWEPSKFTIVSVGRFAYQKRFDRIPQIAKLLRDNGLDFEWIVVGGGDNFDEVKHSIEGSGLSEYIRLIGVQKNPFPFIRQADLMVVTSDYEAHPMVANEALILGTPVVCTPFPSANEIVHNGENGYVSASMAPTDISKAILMFAKDKTLSDHIKETVRTSFYNNDEILLQVCALFF